MATLVSTDIFGDDGSLRIDKRHFEAALKTWDRDAMIRAVAVAMEDPLLETPSVLPEAVVNEFEAQLGGSSLAQLSGDELEEIVKAIAAKLGLSERVAKHYADPLVMDVSNRALSAYVTERQSRDPNYKYNIADTYNDASVLANEASPTYVNVDGTPKERTASFVPNGPSKINITGSGAYDEVALGDYELTSQDTPLGPDFDSANRVLVNKVSGYAHVGTGSGRDVIDIFNTGNGLIVEGLTGIGGVQDVLRLHVDSTKHLQVGPDGTVTDITSMQEALQMLKERGVSFDHELTFEDIRVAEDGAIEFRLPLAIAVAGSAPSNQR